MNLSRGYLLALVAVFGALSLLLVLPFIQYILGAILIAYILYPLQKYLEPRTSPTIAAFALVLLAIAGFVVPFLLVVIAISGDAVAILQDIDPETLQFSQLESRIQETVGIEVNLAEQVSGSGQEVGRILLEQSTSWFSTLTHALVGLGVALFLVYYLLRDGDELLAWMRTTTPLPDAVQDDFYTELDDVMSAVLVGHVLIAVVQGALAGLGLFATGIPNAGFWTFVMVILSLIPLIGSFLVWAPAVVYLFAIGDVLLAVALFAYSTVIVGISDDYLRPIVVDRYAELNPSVIILGVLGGVYAFGIMGLFFGPVVLGALKATLNVMNDHYDRLEGDSSRSSR